MFWPVVLPFQITACVFLVIVTMVTAFRVPKVWSRSTVFFVACALSLSLFVPSCTGVMFVVDSFRFGDFHYDSFDDVPDFRSQRYLPPSATNIEMHKHANGYKTQYDISADDFDRFLEELWSKYGEDSAVRRGGFMDEGQPVNPGMFDLRFQGLGWKPSPEAIVHYSPSEGDGGGATYYFDAKAGRMIQRTGFW